MKIIGEAMFILTEGMPVTNVRRGRNIFGLSVPDELRVGHKLTEEEIIFCDQAEKLIYIAMKQLMPTSAYDKEENSYRVPPINKLFLQKNRTSPIHANCYATTDMDHILGVHVDGQNPNIHDSLDDSFMNKPVGCFAKNKKVKYVDF